MESMPVKTTGTFMELLNICPRTEENFRFRAFSQLALRNACDLSQTLPEHVISDKSFRITRIT